MPLSGRYGTTWSPAQYSRHVLSPARVPANPTLPRRRPALRWRRACLGRQTTATTISAAKAGKFGTHAYSIQLSDDSVRLLHSKYIPDNIWSDIETARTQIIGGKLKVDAIWDALTVRAMMTSVAAPPK